MYHETFSGRAPVVVGILPGQHTHVLRSAKDLALRMNAPLVFAYVDEASYLVEWDPSKQTHRLSMHPEKEDNQVAGVRSELHELITADLGKQPVDWTLRILAGDPARALGRLAEDVHATMIIVGTPEKGLAHRISEALNGSVASWLSHHQSLPVLIVPTPKRGSHAANKDDRTPSAASDTPEAQPDARPGDGEHPQGGPQAASPGTSAE